MIYQSMQDKIYIYKTKKTFKMYRHHALIKLKRQTLLINKENLSRNNIK